MTGQFPKTPSSSRTFGMWNCCQCGQRKTKADHYDRQMMRDEAYFPKPEEFNPDRHLERLKGDKLGGLVKDNDPSNLVYGFGRR